MKQGVEHGKASHAASYPPIRQQQEYQVYIQHSYPYYKNPSSSVKLPHLRRNISVVKQRTTHIIRSTATSSAASCDDRRQIDYYYLLSHMTKWRREEAERSWPCRTTVNVTRVAEMRKEGVHAKVAVTPLALLIEQARKGTTAYCRQEHAA